MWKYILGPLLPAVIGWPWQLGHIEEHNFEENLTDVDPGGDAVPPSNNTYRKGDFWWFEGTIWGFWWSADGFGEDAPWFGTPELPGRLRVDGGWAGYFVDGIGVQAFGSWWPWVACFVMVTFLTGIFGILTYSLHTLTGPCRALGRGVHALCGLCCCRRRDGLDAHLPSARPLMSEIEWHGPKTGWPTETRYLQQRLKGRGSRRRLNDVVVRRGGHVARLLQEESMLKRIDSDGLRVKFNGVSGCTSRQFRRELEEAGEVHLCRQLECRADHTMHIQEFAGVDHEALLDLHRYAHGSPRWLLGLLGRGLWRAFGLGNRVIRDEDGHERMLDPDSESEVEGDESSCQGVRIGLVIEGEMRPLAPDGCNDMATQEETTLLDEDIEVSDVRPPGPGQLARVPLCAHHRQVYQGAAAKRKCGVLTCHKASKGARHGVPLCYDHLCEQGGSGLRKDSPHPNGMLQGLRRRFTRRSTSRSRSPALEQQPDGGGIERHPDSGGVRNKKESGMAPMRSSSVDLGKVMIPSPPRGMLDQDDVMGKPVWMKIKLNYTEGQRECEWIMCLGELVGYTPGGVRGDRKLEIHTKYIETTIVVDPKYLEDMTEAKSVEELDPLKAQLLINDIPQDAACIGLDIKGYIVPEHLVQRLKSWEGRTIGSGRRLNQLQVDYVKKNIATLVRKHSAGFVKGEVWPSWPAEAELGLDVQVRGRAEAQPVGAPEEPRKRSRSRSHSLARVMREEDEVKQKMEGIVEAYATALVSGQNHQEALDTIQMIFEVDFSAIQSTLRNYIRRNCGKQNEQVEVAIKILKGAGAPSYNVTKDEAKPPSAQPEQPAPGEKRLQTTSDKLFPSHFGSAKDESSLIRPAGSIGTQNPLTVSDMGWWDNSSGLGARAGGDEEDGQMGARVVHALEGLRKATEGDKKGNSGTRSSIGSEEGLHVYVARGCNTLTVEVCPDVTGKELFDALKRACSHAKAKLQQIEWPCLVTNGIAYGLAAMQHGGKDHTTLAPWQLSVAHAVTAKPRDFDQYEAPKDDKIEPKPRWEEINMEEKVNTMVVMPAAMMIVWDEAEQDEKVKDSGSQKQGWLPPEEYEGVQYTQLEDELRELTRGPDVNWLRDPMLDGGHKRHITWEKRVEHPEVQRRLKVLEGMERAGVFTRLSSWSSYLQSHVRGRMLNAVIEKQEMTIDDVLLEATEKGCPELAQEAEKVLSEERSVGWADDEKQAWISAPTWQKDKGYGEGKFEFQCGAESICWRYLDYKGDWDPERRPSIEEVKQKAQVFRAELWDEAARAIAELGDPAPWIGAREAEAFVIEELRDVTLQCWRLNCRGQFQVDHLVGSNPGSEGQIIPFLIHGGHIRLLVPNEKEEPVKVAAQLTLSGQTDREWQCEGWREFLANEDTAAPLVPGKRPRCPRCMDGNSKQGKAQPQVPWSFNEHPIDTQELILMGAQMPLKHRPSFAYGVRVQEMFAGSGAWTQAMGEAGIAFNEPVELYGDPLQKQDKRDHFDLKNEAVANRYLQAAMELPGPHAANIWEFGTPCTSYCDFNLLNGGTRSFTSPEGGPVPTQSEEEGNYFCELTSRLCQSLYDHDKEFVLESSMPSGRYPKIWDQPAIQRLQQSTGALIVPTHLCEWGASPSDRPEMRYKKGQWNLEYLGQGEHRCIQHVSALVVQAAYAGWDTMQVAQALEVIQEDDGREGALPYKAKAGKLATPYTSATSSSSSTPSPGERCGSAEGSEFQGGFFILREHYCGSIGESEFAQGIPIPPEELLEGEGEEEESMSDDDRRMNPRDEAAVMARLIPREVAPDEAPDPVRPYEGRINVFGPPRPLEGLNGRSEDWWDYQEDTLFLVRHHVMPRRNMFGSHYGDWIDCPVSDHLIRSDRRTWMFPQRRDLAEIVPHERVFLDNWRVDLARLRDIPDSIEAEYADWTGATTFYLYDPEIRPELGRHFGHGQEEGEGEDAQHDANDGLQPGLPEGRDYVPVFRAPQEFDPPSQAQVEAARRYYPGGGVWDPWNGGRIEGEEHDNSEAADRPRSSSDRPRRSRSRSRGRAATQDGDGSDRRVGYLAASYALEQEEEQACGWLDHRPEFEESHQVGYGDTHAKNEGVSQEVFDKALKYMEHCREHPKYDAEVIKTAVKLGDDLLKTAKTLESAMRGLREARRKVIGVPTNGATSKEVLDCLEADHADYLKAMNGEGLRTRRYYPPRRVKAEPYPSAVDHPEEMYQKAWKDGHWGIVLFASDLTEEYTKTLIECPQGRDTSDFGSALPGDPVGVEGRVKMIYGGLPFGWCGAPGEYMAFALAGRAYHENFKPSEETINGPSPFSSEWLMDDSVVVEPLVGVRPWQAVDSLGHAIEKIWGQDALNLEKQIEEGTPATEQIVWGLFMNVDSMTIRLPEPKALKMRYLLALPELQYGERMVCLKVAQELRGLGQYAAITIPPLRTELSTIDLFLCPSRCEGGYIRPNVNDEESSERAWRCWDEMLALLRLWFETPYEGTFEASMESMLTTRELLALPGMSERLRWVGGDATPEVAGALDWKTKRYMREDAREMLHALGKVPELVDDPEMKIALAELLCFVGLAAAESREWQGELIAYATDNQNVRSWLTKRQSKCAVARHMLRILGMLEVRFHFKTVAFYIRTYHNITADWLSRETKKVVETQMERDGWSKVEVGENWAHYIDESVAGIFRWPGGESLGSMSQAPNGENKPYRPVVASGYAVELGRGMLPWVVAWHRLGGQVCRIDAKCTPLDEKLERSLFHDIDLVTEEIELSWAFASVAEDSWGGSRTYVKNFVKKHRPRCVLIDVAKDGPVDDLQMDLEKLGYKTSTFDCLTTHYGDPVAKRKVIVLGALHDGRSVKPEWLDRNTELTLNSKISTSGDRMLPWPAGHFRENHIDDQKELLYDIRGPALTCRKGRSMVVLDHRGTEVQARRLGPEEEWLLNGGRLDDVRALHELGSSQEYFKKNAAMKFPQQSAPRIVAWFERWRQDQETADASSEAKVGVCTDPDRLKADEHVRAWMRAWQGDHQNPQANYEKWLMSHRHGIEEVDKVGGRRQTPSKRAKSAPPDRLVLPSAIGRGRERLQLDANKELRRDQAWLDALAAEAVMSKLSEGTRGGYEVGWKQWCLWRRMGNKSVYLTGETKDERKADEDELLRFMTYLAHVMHGADRRDGHDDPTMNRVRIWAALNGYKRWQPETKRKYPVLPGMLTWIRRHLSTSETLSKCDQVILWAAIMVGFFFLLRASEFLVTIGRSWGSTRTLKGSDIKARKDNKQVANFYQAEEIVIYLKGSKTDQYNQGTVRNQFRSGDELCVAAALADYQNMRPERFAGAEENQPLFRFEDGKPLQRGDIQNLIQLAAVADGQSTTRYGSHSLRIGGATAMYQTTKDLDVVKRFGRWNSDAFHGYLWESHERQKDLAKGMARADGQLLAPRKNKGYEAERHPLEKSKAVNNQSRQHGTARVGALIDEGEHEALGDFSDEEHGARGYIIPSVEEIPAEESYGDYGDGMEVRPKGLRSRGSKSSDFSSTAKSTSAPFSVCEKI
ncbi:unnamed protein product [Durusdinium trenchii]|uniref:Uncharacterized protein n=1 Tax=Durusdinium trenchii TaxID=1381693 RepID=A0ABP0J7N1_9DINO